MGYKNHHQYKINEYSDVNEWQNILNNLDKYELILMSSGDLLGTVDLNTIPLDEQLLIEKRLPPFWIRHSEFSPNKPLKQEVKKWITKQFEISVINTI